LDRSDNRRVGQSPANQLKQMPILTPWKRRETGGLPHGWQNVLHFTI
jgi:hypothetical protein